MRSMKRVRLAVVFLIAAALFVATPTPAAGAGPTERRVLTCAVDETDPDYGASGVAKFSDLKAWYPTLQVKCNGLTPGAVYEVWLFRFIWSDPPGPGEEGGVWQVFTADKWGRGSVQGNMAWPISRTEVRRTDQTTSVVVLSGTW
jgi:hypothetical protein